jgi:hypothetical protein
MSIFALWQTTICFTQGPTFFILAPCFWQPAIPANCFTPGSPVRPRGTTFVQGINTQSNRRYQRCDEDNNHGGPAHESQVRCYRHWSRNPSDGSNLCIGKEAPRIALEFDSCGFDLPHSQEFFYFHMM